jgi:hypothetical protein
MITFDYVIMNVISVFIMKFRFILQYMIQAN